MLTQNAVRKDISGRGIGFFLALTMIVFIAWANYFQLDVTVRAQGTVIAKSRSQVIQAPDGGVVKELFVREGDRVKKGQVLAQLEENRAAASLGELYVKLESLEVSKVRAEAQAMLEEPDFSSFTDEVENVVTAQQALYDQSKFTLEENVSRLNSTLEIAKKEANSASNLLRNGDISRKESNDAQIRYLDAQGAVDLLYSDYQTNARKEVVDIEAEIATLRYEIKNRDVNLQYTRIASPVDGVVTLINVNTLGGVLRPSDQLLQITPTDSRYVIEAKILPADIGQLQIGQPVTVKLASYDFTVYGSLEGRLNYISADTIPEQNSNGQTIAFYNALVEVDKDSQTNNRINADEAMKPGVTSTVDIRTGKRTILEFLAMPIMRAFGGALTQD